jgi:hypothetical protein
MTSVRKKVVVTGVFTKRLVTTMTTSVRKEFRSGTDICFIVYVKDESVIDVSQMFIMS